MSAERPSFEAKSSQDASWTLPESFRKAVDEMRPDGLDWHRIDAAMSVLKGEKEAVAPKPPEPEPTERQLFWRDMYRTGNLSSYQKDRPGISWEAIQAAWSDPQSQGETSKIMAVDMALRGGADKEYNHLGGVGHRAKRMTVMAGNLVPFWTFDVVTGIPSGMLIEYFKYKKDNKSKDKNTSNNGKNNELVKDSFLGGAKKLMEVQNDKVVTALGDIMVTKLTGEKGAWTHEAADKSADLLGTAMEDYLKDAINGPVIESILRFSYQIPVFGALSEQFWTRLSALQEKSPLNKGIAKSFYMSLGTLIYIWRNVEGVHISKRKAPSTKIAHWLWGKMFPNMKNELLEEA